MGVEILKQIRKEKRVGQKELADALNLSIGAYSQLENGQTKMTIEKAEIISNVLDISPMIFFTEQLQNNWNLK